MSFKEDKRSMIQSWEYSYLMALMSRHKGNVTKAAEETCVLRCNLHRMLTKYGLKSAQFRVASEEGHVTSNEDHIS